MKFDVQWIDVTKNLVEGTQPVLFLKRPLLHGTDKRGALFASAEVARTGTYYVPQSTLVGPVEVEWGVTKQGEHVRVPVEAYRTTVRSLSAIFAVGMEIGMRAVVALQRKTRAEPNLVTLVLGHDITDLPDENAFRCYVGMAIRVD